MSNRPFIRYSLACAKARRDAMRRRDFAGLAGWDGATSTVALLRFKYRDPPSKGK